MHSTQFPVRFPSRESSIPSRHSSLPPLPPSHSRTLAHPRRTRFSQSHECAQHPVKLSSNSIQNANEDAARATVPTPTSAVVSRPSMHAVPKGITDSDARDSPRTTHDFIQPHENPVFHSPRRLIQHHPDNRTDSMNLPWGRRTSGIHASHFQNNEPSYGLDGNAVRKRRRGHVSGFNRIRKTGHEAHKNFDMSHSLDWRSYRRQYSLQNRNSDGNDWQRFERQNSNQSRRLDCAEKSYDRHPNEANFGQTGASERPIVRKEVLFNANTLSPVPEESSLSGEACGRRCHKECLKTDCWDCSYHSEPSTPSDLVNINGNTARGSTRYGLRQDCQTEHPLDGSSCFEARTDSAVENQQHVSDRLEKRLPFHAKQHKEVKSLYNCQPVEQASQKNNESEDLRHLRLQNDCCATILDAPAGMSASDLKRELSRVGVIYVSAPVKGKAVIEFASPGRRAAAVARGYLLLSNLRLGIRLCRPDDLPSGVSVEQKNCSISGLDPDATDNGDRVAVANGERNKKDADEAIAADANNTKQDSGTFEAAVFGIVMNKVMENIVKRIGAENYSTGFREVFAHVEGKSKENSRKLAERRDENKETAKRCRTLAEQNLDEYLMGGPKQESKKSTVDEGSKTKIALPEVRIPRKQIVKPALENYRIPSKNVANVEKNDTSGDSSQFNQKSGGGATRNADSEGSKGGTCNSMLLKIKQDGEKVGVELGVKHITDKPGTERDFAKAEHTNGKIVSVGKVVHNEISCRMEVSRVSIRSVYPTREHRNTENHMPPSGARSDKAEDTGTVNREKKRPAPVTEDTRTALAGKKGSIAIKILGPVPKRRRKTTVPPGVKKSRSGAKRTRPSETESKEREIVILNDFCKESRTEMVGDGIRLRDKQSGNDGECGKDIKAVVRGVHAETVERAAGVEEPQERMVKMNTLTGEQLVEAELASLGKEELEEVKVREGMCARTEGIRWVRGGGKLVRKDGKENGKVRVVRPQEEMGKESKRANRQEQRLLRKTMRQISADVEGLTLNVLQQRRKRVYTRKSAIHGMGLYAQEDIGIGELVIEYVGSVVRRSVADVREMRYEEQGIGDSYMFRMNSDSVIDATHRGGIGRYINHSCEPNLIAKVIAIGSEDHIVFYSKKSIRVHDELTYDYKFAVEGEDQKILCLCQAPSCRKFLN